MLMQSMHRGVCMSVPCKCYDASPTQGCNSQPGLKKLPDTIEDFNSFEVGSLVFAVHSF